MRDESATVVGCEPEAEWVGGLATLYAFVELCLCVECLRVVRYFGSSGVRFGLT